MKLRKRFFLFIWKKLIIKMVQFFFGSTWVLTLLLHSLNTINSRLAIDMFCIPNSLISGLVSDAMDSSKMTSVYRSLVSGISHLRLGDLALGISTQNWFCLVQTNVPALIVKINCWHHEHNCQKADSDQIEKLKEYF